MTNGMTKRILELLYGRAGRIAADEVDILLTALANKIQGESFLITEINEVKQVLDNYGY